MTVPNGMPERPVRSAREVRQIVLAIAVVLLLAVVLMAACGNRGDGATGAPAATPDRATGPAADQATAPAETATLPPTDAPPAATDLAAATLPAASTALTATAPLTANGVSTATGAPTGSLALTEAVAAPGACAIETSAELAGYDALTDRMGCPTAEASVEPVAINEFGPGPEYTRFMLWFGAEQQIYVLQPDGAWLAYTDTWSESDPEIVCNPDNLDPATSPPLPRRGFGKLWCTVESVRLAMGPIDREERLCQHAVVQRFEQGRLLACFEDATIRYFRMLEDGTWDIEMVQ